MADGSRPTLDDGKQWIGNARTDQLVDLSDGRLVVESSLTQSIPFTNVARGPAVQPEGVSPRTDLGLNDQTGADREGIYVAEIPIRAIS